MTTFGLILVGVWFIAGFVSLVAVYVWLFEVDVLMLPFGVARQMGVILVMALAVAPVIMLGPIVGAALACVVRIRFGSWRWWDLTNSGGKWMIYGGGR